MAERAEEARAEARRNLMHQAQMNIMRSSNPEVARLIFSKTVSISDWFRRPKRVTWWKSGEKKKSVQEPPSWFQESNPSYWLDHALRGRGAPSGDGALRGDVSDEMLFEIFRDLDRDRQGTINVKQIVKAMRKCGLNVSRRAIKRVLIDMDRDPDRPLSVQDFVRFFRHAEQLDDTARVTELRSRGCTYLMSFALFVNTIVFGVYVILLTGEDKDKDYEGYWMKAMGAIISGSVLGALTFCLLIVPICRFNAPDQDTIAAVTPAALSSIGKDSNVQVKSVQVQPVRAVPQTIDWAAEGNTHPQKDWVATQSPTQQHSYRFLQSKMNQVDPAGVSLGPDDVSILRAAAQMPALGDPRISQAPVVCQVSTRGPMRGYNDPATQYNPRDYKVAENVARMQVVPQNFNAFSTRQEVPPRPLVPTAHVAQRPVAQGGGYAAGSRRPGVHSGGDSEHSVLDTTTTRPLNTL